MLARRVVLQKILKGHHLRVTPPVNCRNLHTIRSTPNSLVLLSNLSCKRGENRIAGYLLFCRNESTSTTVTRIPPLTSEVFSKQVETSHTNLVPPSEAVGQGVSAGASNASSNAEVLNATSVEAEAISVTAQDSQQSLPWESIPAPPEVPAGTEELVAALSANGEPAFTSLGLGGWTPSGIVQQCLEFFHVGLDLPWWGAIMLGTVCVRLLVFPLVVKSQRNAAKMANNLPEMQHLQVKMTEARQTGNHLMSAKYAQELMLFMKEKDISPFKNMLVPLAMAPIFISFFFGLRKMANLPVESMKEGGLFWFTDLTLADPYFILPMMTSVTMLITLELGVDGAQLSTSQHGQVMRYVIRAIPVIVFPLTMNFPAAILCYWVSTNGVSLIQALTLKIPSVRNALNIETRRKFSPDSLPIKPKRFVESVKDSWTNVKITKEMEDRVRYDEMSFKRAGRGPIPKTYKYDPTKVAPNAVQAKPKP